LETVRQVEAIINGKVPTGAVHANHWTRHPLSADKELVKITADIHQRSQKMQFFKKRRCRTGRHSMSGLGLGRVKTPTFNLRVEIPSRFRKFENQKCLRPLLREDDRENNSAHSWLVLVFTQPGSFATEARCPHYVRFTPDSDRNAEWFHRSLPLQLH
jgi:hypothetical protein